MPNQILRTYKLTKKINDGVILDNLCIDLFENEILGLTGPYHSGKEILPMIFSGAVKADSGKIFLSEKEIKITSRKSAQKNRIFTIDKQPCLITGLSVAENICIASTLTKGLFYKKEQTTSFVCDLFEEFQLNINPFDSVKNLSIFEKHIISFISAYIHGAKVILADHVLSFYDKEESEFLFSLLNKLKKKGISTILIDNYHSILFYKSDRIMVMKNGKNMGSFYKEEISEKIVQELTGKKDTVSDPFPHRQKNTEPVLWADQITSPLLKTPVSFSAQKGEMIGFSGAKYSELSGLMYTLAGRSRLLTGEITLYQKPLNLKSIHHALKEGIWMLPHNWESTALFPDMSVKDNICIMYFNRISTWNFINERLRNYSARQVMRRAGIPEKYLNIKMRKLSPEHQQKLLTAKLLHSKLKVLLLDEPFLYHDAAQKREVSAFLSELSSQGVIVLLFASSRQRLEGFCDRIYLIDN